jgi:BirA family transcriptional regulator, biotin operon repressor / biotin---[acetyl-CoA-carboxylase] ligase
MSFGLPHRHFARTDSTNSRARELAAAGAPHGTVVTATEQTAGRGRQGRTWTAPAGKALLYSAVVRPLEERHMTLPLAVPLAVSEAAEQLNPHLECKVKWPNDIHVEGRKLAGVLIEARPQDGWAVIGVGLNLTISQNEFPPDLRHTAASIFAARGIDREGGSSGPSPLLSGGPPLPVPSTAAEVLSQHLDSWVQAEPDEVLAAWRERDALRGREVEWDGGSGVADGVDDRGYLVVLAPGGDRIAVGAGEVHLTRF